MKINEYNQMMKYLTRPGKVLGNNINRKNFSKGSKREENIEERIARVQYELGDKKERPKHLDNKDIYSFEDRPKKVAKKIPVLPPKPDMVNGHSDWNTEDWLESIDPGGWMHDDKKKAGLLEYELADEYWQEQYQIYLDNGGQLNYQQYMQQQMKNKISKEIDKRVKDKLKTEGLAAILGVPGNKI